MKNFLILFSLFILISCVQDSPNVQQIGNMQFFIDNKKNVEVFEIEPGLQYSVINQGDASGPNP
jgi:hypothetical protein